MVGGMKQGSPVAARSLPERCARLAKQVLGLAPCPRGELGALGLELGPAALVELAGHIALAHRQLAAAGAQLS